MKKIFCLLLSCFLLCGCSTIKPMTINEAELNEDEKGILRLVGKSCYIYDFNVDSTVNEMVLTFYELGEEEWDALKQINVELTSNQGRILIDYTDMREYIFMSYQMDEDYGMAALRDIHDTTLIDGGGAAIGGEEKIVPNREIALALQVNSEKVEIETRLLGPLSELYSFYSSREYEEVYMVTALFK